MPGFRKAVDRLIRLPRAAATAVGDAPPPGASHLRTALHPYIPTSQADQEAALLTAALAEVVGYEVRLGTGQAVGLGRDALGEFHALQVYLVDLLGLQQTGAVGHVQTAAGDVVLAVADPAAALTAVLGQVMELTGLDQGSVVDGLIGVFGGLPGIGVMFGLVQVTRHGVALFQSTYGLLYAKGTGAQADSAIVQYGYAAVGRVRSRQALHATATFTTAIAATGVAAATGFGGAVVADSEWQAEYEESIAKVRVLMQTLQGL